MKKRSLMEKTGVGACLLLCVLLVFALQAETSDTLPAAKITEPSVLWNPGKLAIDNQLVVYAIDSYKNRVHRFDNTGSHLGLINVDRPSAVAVGSDGTVYVGSHRDYSVAIYKAGKCTGYLGGGKGEFSSILDLAVDPNTGDVYAADPLKNTISIYSAKGRLRGTFSGFSAPVAVAVTLDDVYVLDSPVTGSFEGPGTGSRISVFSKSGAYRWSIDERGIKDRYMARPVDIAVDGMGNIFVADTGKNAVLVYDKRGIFIGQITGPGDVIHPAVSLVLSRDSRLYVSSGETRSILEIGLGGSVYSETNVSVDFQSKTGDRLAPAVLGY